MRSKYLMSEVISATAWMEPGISDPRAVEQVLASSNTPGFLDELLELNRAAREVDMQREIKLHLSRELRRRLEPLGIGLPSSMGVIDVLVVHYSGKDEVRKGHKFTKGMLLGINGGNRLNALRDAKSSGKLNVGIPISVWVLESDSLDAIETLITDLDDARGSRKASEQVRLVFGSNTGFSVEALTRANTAIQNLIRMDEGNKNLDIPRIVPTFSVFQVSSSFWTRIVCYQYEDAWTWFAKNFRNVRGNRCLNVGIVTAMIHSWFTFGDSVTEKWLDFVSGRKLDDEMLEFRKDLYNENGKSDLQNPGGSSGQIYHYKRAIYALMREMRLHGQEKAEFDRGATYNLVLGVTMAPPANRKQSNVSGGKSGKSSKSCKVTVKTTIQV